MAIPAAQIILPTLGGPHLSLLQKCSQNTYGSNENQASALKPTRKSMMKMHFKFGKPIVRWKQGQARLYGVFASAHMKPSFSKGYCDPSGRQI